MQVVKHSDLAIIEPWSFLKTLGFEKLGSTWSWKDLQVTIGDRAVLNQKAVFTDPAKLLRLISNRVWYLSNAPNPDEEVLRFYVPLDYTIEQAKECLLALLGQVDFDGVLFYYTNDSEGTMITRRSRTWGEAKEQVAPIPNDM